MRRRMLHWMIAGHIIGAMATGQTFSVIRTVDDDDPGADFNNIQQAIDASSSGDIVSVSCGTYVENILMKDGVSVLGAGADCTTLDGSQIGTVATFIFVSAGTELSGFTIQNGLSFEGGGIFLDDSQATITRNIIRDNTVVRTPAGNLGVGGGISVYCSSPTISNNLIVDNTAAFGGGMEIAFSFPLIINNTIVWNIAERPGPAFGFGGGLLMQSSDPTISTNIIFGNFSEAGGGGIDLGGSSLTVIEYTNTYQNTPANIVGSYTAGIGNMSQDPLFQSSAGPSYCVNSDSPILDAGPPIAPADPSDLFGRSRVQDGDFDGTATVDLGYCESDEVTNLTVGAGGLVSWDASANSSAVYNLYRGLLSELVTSCATSCVYSQDPVIVLEAQQVCDLASPSFTDPDVPPLGDAHYYLATGEDLVEGGLGWLGGAARNHDNPCL